MGPTHRQPGVALVTGRSSFQLGWSFLNWELAVGNNRSDWFSRIERKGQFYDREIPGRELLFLVLPVTLHFSLLHRGMACCLQVEGKDQGSEIFLSYLGSSLVAFL